jgi:hypothetical protein
VGGEREPGQGRTGGRKGASREAPTSIYISCLYLYQWGRDLFPSFSLHEGEREEQFKARKKAHASHAQHPSPTTAFFFSINQRAVEGIGAGET